MGGFVSNKWGKIVRVCKPPRANTIKIKGKVEVADNSGIGGIRDQSELTANEMPRSDSLGESSFCESLLSLKAEENSV